MIVPGTKGSATPPGRPEVDPKYLLIAAAMDHAEQAQRAPEPPATAKAL